MAGLPPRWLDCPPAGREIERFVPFKVPLDDRYLSLIPFDRLWTPDHVIAHGQSLAEGKGGIGLVIDLTKTERYYDKYLFERKKVEYCKIPCEGRGAVPTNEQVALFIDTCRAFWERSPERFIGVHCTHGFNRSGYMISCFLTQEHGWDVAAAAMQFAAARPPGIYKPHYLRELYEKYDEDVAHIVAPELPSWHADDEDDEPGPGGTKRRREDLDFNYGTVPREAEQLTMTGVHGEIGRLVEGAEMEDVRRRCIEYCHGRSSQFPGAQPVSLDRTTMQQFRYEPFLVSWKADGTRYLMLILRHAVYMVDRNFRVFRIDGMTFLQRKSPGQPLDNTLVDGEMVIDEDPQSGDKRNRYLIYDLVCFNGMDFGQLQAYSTRLEAAKVEVIMPRDKERAANPARFASEPFSVRLKKFWPIKDIVEVINFRKTVAHETDGLIFAAANEKYVSGRDNKMFKWKPADMNSVDFLLRVEERRSEGMLAETIGNLFIQGRGGQLELYHTMRNPSKEVRQHDGKVIECSLDQRTRKWVFMRVRADKSHPNAAHTVAGVERSIQDNLTEKEVVEFVRQQAFRAPT